MTLDQFRKLHSEIIEHYQFIEMHLEGIYAALSEKSFFEGLIDVDHDSISRIVTKIKELDSKHTVLTEDDLNRIKELTVRRNYWTHACYTDMVFDRRTNAPREKYIPQFLEDLKIARDFREYIFNKKIELDIRGKY